MRVDIYWLARVTANEITDLCFFFVFIFLENRSFVVESGVRYSGETYMYVVKVWCRVFRSLSIRAYVTPTSYTWVSSSLARCKQCHIQLCFSPLFLLACAVYQAIEATQVPLSVTVISWLTVEVCVDIFIRHPAEARTATAYMPRRKSLPEWKPDIFKKDLLQNKYFSHLIRQKTFVTL